MGLKIKKVTMMGVGPFDLYISDMIRVTSKPLTDFGKIFV
jgi:hypothetical protein